MSKGRNWVFIGGAISVVVALWLGVPLTTILLVCLALACPAAMYFGMGGKGMRKDRNDPNEGSAERRDRDAGPRKTA